MADSPKCLFGSFGSNTFYLVFTFEENVIQSAFTVNVVHIVNVCSLNNNHIPQN